MTSICWITHMISEYRKLLRLQSWLSTSFPIGAFSYSHGLEYAVEAGLVGDRNSLIDWLDADLRHGSGRNEAIFLVAALNTEGEEFQEIVELAGASFATRELALESLSQGQAFLQIVRKAWPHEEMICPARPPTLAIALAIACKAHGIDTESSLLLYLQSWLANLINAAVRLVPIGQTDGQLAQAELENAVIDVAAIAIKSTIEDLGSAAVMVDWTSMQHETQYTRLFRS